jgi:acetolactate synthase regulatory subunit
MSDAPSSWRARRTPFPPLIPNVRTTVMKHTLIALVQDRPGVLNRAMSLFRRRGLNIESLTVTRAPRDGVSQMTWVVEATDITPVIAQLEKLIEVLEVHETRTDGAPPSVSPQSPARAETPRSMFAISQADGIA